MERISESKKKILFWLFVSIIIFSGVTGFILTRFKSNSVNIGVQALEIMYQFEDLEDLDRNYNKLEIILDESLWDDFSLLNESRMISTYFKFNNSKSEIEYVYISDGIIVYRLVNDYIDPENLYVFEYEREGRKITKFREYEMKGVKQGGEGVLY